MKKIRDSFLTTLGLICRVPLSFRYNVNFSLFPFFYPVIGLIVSALVLGLFLLFNPLFISSGIIVFLVLLFQYGAFNLFHFDGLLDCADAFFFNTNMAKRLTILTDKRLGSFAIFSGAIYLVLKFYLLVNAVSALNTPGVPWTWIIIVFAYPLTGRIASTLMPLFIPPAGDPGLAELLADYSPLAATGGIVLTLAVPAALIISTVQVHFDIFLTMAPFTAAIISGILISFISKKFVGGYTGDSLGLTVEIGEIIHLMISIEILGRLF